MHHAARFIPYFFGSSLPRQVPTMRQSDEEGSGTESIDGPCDENVTRSIHSPAKGRYPVE